MSYEVKLDVYQGPLDLLLQLISRERVNVAEINISELTDEFLRRMAELGEVDLETASSFLVLAATLLELKSLKLLPNRHAIDPEIKLLLEERDRLLHRLIVYAAFKQAAIGLGYLLGECADLHPRTAELPEELIPKSPDIFQGLTPVLVAAAAVRALTPVEQEPVDTSHVTSVTVSLVEMVERLRLQIRLNGNSSFRELCRSASGRMEVVVALLAVLELFKAEAIELIQAEPFSEIAVSWLPAP
ncbi:MAG: segregation and condensation protein A [Actinomycetota bacterium]